ncbi:MAG: penicillin-binding transpeptidase domain-containing protein [Polyangiaceae bacterium]
MRKRWKVVAGVLPALGLALVVSRCGHGKAPNAQVADEDVPLARRIFRAGVENDPAALPPLTGMDLTQLALDDKGVSTTLPDKTTVRLTLDPKLQKMATSLLSTYKMPESALVVMDVATGRILAYASHVDQGQAHDLNVEATAPAASVFKMVTGSALVEYAHLTADEKQCYSGGEQKLTATDLEPDAARDKYCTTLGGAMGRSINTVFARLALGHLKREQLQEMGQNLFFGKTLPFDVPVQSSALSLPEDRLGFARTAAGFWNTTLSPLHATWLSATFARNGVPIRPVIVREVEREAGKKVVYTLGEPKPMKRALSEATSAQVVSMLEQTVSDGTSFKAFHDKARQPFLPGIDVAGKTGTLTDAGTQRYYTWFTGFAPSKPVEGVPQIAVTALAANGAVWKVKANVLAREILRAYFAQVGVKGVSMPVENKAAKANDKSRRGRRRAR